MVRPSKIDRLSDGIQAEINRLRQRGRTLGEILEKLQELLPPEERPSWSGLQRHMQKRDALAERYRLADAMASRLVGPPGDGRDDLVLRGAAKLMGGMLFDVLSGGETGEQVILDPKEAKAYSEALRNAAATQKLVADTSKRELEVRAMVSAAERPAEDAEAPAGPVVTLPGNGR